MIPEAEISLKDSPVHGAGFSSAKSRSCILRHLLQGESMMLKRMILLLGVGLLLVGLRPAPTAAAAIGNLTLGGRSALPPEQL